MNPKGNNKPKPTKKTKFAMVLAKSPLTLSDVKRMSMVNRTTLTDMKLRGDTNYAERTKIAVAACFGMTPDELFPQNKARYNTPFERLRLAKNKTIADVRMGTGLSYNLLNKLDMGIHSNLSKRTKKDLIDYFETTEEELFPSGEAKNRSDENTDK